MMTPEQFAKKQADERAAFEREQAIQVQVAAAGIPLPEYIGGVLYGARGITYRNDRTAPRSFAAALDMVAAFPAIVPFAVMRSGCTIMAPESALPEKEKAKGYKRDEYWNGSDYAFSLDVGHITASPAPTHATLDFFARAGGMLLSVSIEFGTGYIGSCPQLAPRRKEHRHTSSGRIDSVTFDPNDKAYALADSVISFGSGDMGPIKTSADHRFLFVSDHGADECTPDDCSHALAQLRILAEQIGG